MDRPARELFGRPAGLAPLAPWNEPLAIYLLYHGTQWLGASSFQDISRSLFILELLLGCGFILNCWLIVKNLFLSRRQQLLSLVFVLSFPYMTFFMGYVETYAVSLYLLSLFALGSVLVINGRLSFALMPLVYLMTAAGHAVYGAFGLAVLYLAVREFRSRGLRSVLVGAGIALAAFLFFRREPPQGSRIWATVLLISCLQALP